MSLCLFLILIGYFLQTILIPIPDIDILTKQEIVNIQKKEAINYDLGNKLMFLGSVLLIVLSLLYVIDSIKTFLKEK